MAELRTVLHCVRGDYTTAVIGDPYGIPEELVGFCVDAHETAHSGHRVQRVPECRTARR